MDILNSKKYKFNSSIPTIGSLCPDGFSFDFIRTFWDILKHDFVNAIREFFISSKFPPGCNSSFIALIPKKHDAKFVKDYRPISLIGCFYNIVSKILANRLKMVISELISDVQSAFVSNRQILDGPFILNELISWCKAHKSKAMIFKVDFEKAFDSVRWDFLDIILRNFGFGIKWRGWIQGCLSSAMGSILVNGSPTAEFKFHKGLKQGDPLSPYLFILVMESLHLSFNNIINADLFKGIRFDDSLTLSHLFYADDAVFIGKWDRANILTIVRMLKCFFLASGLQINILKSKLMGIGVSNEEVLAAANIIGCSTFSTPFSYLGVKVGMSPSRRKAWDEIIGSVFSLSPWNCNLEIAQNTLSSKDLFPRLYSLEPQKRYYGADKLIDATFAASFRRNPRRVEEEQLHHLVELVGSISLTPTNDRLACFLDLLIILGYENDLAWFKTTRFSKAQWKCKKGYYVMWWMNMEIPQPCAFWISHPRMEHLFDEQCFRTLLLVFQ
ncbi:RNA-directed DNA polymerase, eukaryota [Tanacetum coccineum]|uniref:RNA-directed DNA polymerase, eukaryota n=1 Tax=Tanacetum coccineum TaxID=301880 RepID=A0ABQ5HID3_9ASTR